MNVFAKTRPLLGLMLWLACWLMPLAAQANDDPARLYLQTVPLQDEKLLVVNVILADVVELYGADFQLQYDPAQFTVQDAVPRLEGVQIAPGSLLEADSRLVVQNIVDTDTGLVNFAATLLNPAPPVSGQGVLASVTFEVVGPGPYTIEVASAKLISAGLETLPVTTTDLRLDGGLEPIGPTPPTAFSLPWWGWPGLAVLLALVGVVLFSLARTRGRLQVPPVASRRMPRGSLSPARSSASLAEQGHRALEGGQVEMAYELFSQAVELDPANADAWLGKGLVAQQVAEKRICFQRVLALDPANAIAQAELAQLGR